MFYTYTPSIVELSEVASLADSVDASLLPLSGVL